MLFVRSVCACLDLSVSSSSWDLGRAAVCDCDTPWTFLLPFLTYNPITIGPGQQLSVRFPNLGKHDVIVPWTARLPFTITLNSDDLNRTLVQNIGRAIIRKNEVKRKNEGTK